MNLSSDDIPQADRLEDVVRTVQTVSEGNETFEEIAAAIGKGDRQGRYYRLATELLGLTRHAGVNRSVTTPQGQALLAASNEQRRQLLADIVLASPALGGAFDLIAGAGQASVEDVAKYLEASGLSAITARRRVSSVVTWLQDLQLIARQGNDLRPVWRPTFDGKVVEVIESVPPSPAPPPGFTLLGELPRTKWKKTTRDSDAEVLAENKTEMASGRHSDLIELIADILRRAGLVSQRTGLIDLFSEVSEEQSIMFEMKTVSGNNLHTQTRKAVAQLLEYRYVYQLAPVTLCLVLEHPATNILSWLYDFMIDIDIHVCWPKEQKVECPDTSRDALKRLVAA